MVPVKCRQHAFTPGNFRLRLLAKKLPDDVANFVPLAGGQDAIDARRNVALIVAERGHTTGGDELLLSNLVIENFLNDTNRLSAGSTEKAARVNDDDIRDG